MKPKNVLLLGLILMLFGFVTPRIVHSFSLSFGIVLVLCSVIGLLMTIIGATRLGGAKKTEGDV
jgi:hypothetical protein